jgi:hypothetical protein
MSFCGAKVLPPQNEQMSAKTTSLLGVGRVIEIRFPAFTPRITVHPERELTVEIVSGDNAGFSDTVEYEAVCVRDGLVILSWREHDRPRARYRLR